MGFDKFSELVKDQFMYGGKKYSLNNQRESTDELFDRHTYRWLIGTMDKYTFRFRNLERERDLLKIACYCYILWLKKGFFVKPEGLKEESLDTNVQMKEQFFDCFIEKYQQWEITKSNSTYNIDVISKTLAMFSLKGWNMINESLIFLILDNCYHTWRQKYANEVTHDTDTYNEAKVNK